MARRQRKLVSKLWQRELGIRRTRADAASHRQHQRSADQARGSQISLAARPASGRSSLAERARALTRGNARARASRAVTPAILLFEAARPARIAFVFRRVLGRFPRTVG